MFKRIDPKSWLASRSAAAPTSETFNGLLLSIGAMKAGTSWIYMMLREHPEIEVTPVKETNYFWDRYGHFRALTPEQRRDTLVYNLPRILSHTSAGELPAVLSWFRDYVSGPVDDAWFANLFPNRASAKYSADFSNLYSALGERAWEHIRQLSSNVRVLYTLRSPLGRLWSHVRFQAQLCGCFAEVSRWTEAEFTCFMAQHGLAASGAYAKTLQFLSSEFDPDRYLVCQFRDIGDSPESFLRRVESFLEIRAHNYSPAALTFASNASAPLEAPAHFYRAALPIIEIELEALARLNFPVPADWYAEAENARLGCGLAAAAVSRERMIRSA